MFWWGASDLSSPMFFTGCGLSHCYWDSSDDNYLPTAAFWLESQDFPKESAQAELSILIFEHAAGSDLVDLGGKWWERRMNLQLYEALLILLF